MLRPFVLLDFPFQPGGPLLNLSFEVSVGFPEILFGPFSRPAFLRFSKGPLDGRREPLLKAVLQDIILGPLGKDFDGPVFSDGTGDENEGDIRAPSSGLGKGQSAIVMGEVIVRKDEIRGKLLKFADVFRFVHNHFRDQGESRFLQFELGQLGIGRPVFQDKDANGISQNRIPD
jgi:hypothetical protein